VRGAALGVRFLLELGMLVALSNWGFEASSDVLAFVLGIGLPVVAMAAWGMFVSPKARVRLPELPRQGVAMAMFALGAVALAASGYPSSPSC
jgi:hypothetical protein